MSAHAAAPTISQITLSQDTNSNNGVAVVLPATIAANDLIFILACIDTNNVFTAPTDFTATSGETGSRLVSYWKKAVGDEDGTSVTTGVAGAHVSRNASFIVSGADDPAVTPPESTNQATGTSTGPDSGELDATFSGRDTLYISGACVDSDPTTTTYPSSYDDNQTRSTYTTANVTTLTFASRGETASDGIENPGAFLMDESQLWGARTIAIPAAATGVPIAILNPPRRVP